MSYFPFFINIENKHCVIVGGGKVAFRKAEKLLPFGVKITVVAENICQEMAGLSAVTVRQKSFQYEDISGAFMVVTATDNRELNRAIYQYCQKRNILINTVDEQENCGFIFPSIVKGENFTVAVSTGGRSPLYAKYLREKIETEVVGNSDKIIAVLSSLRKIVKERVHDEPTRKAVFARIMQQCIDGEKAVAIDQILKETEA